MYSRSECGRTFKVDEHCVGSYIQRDMEYAKQRMLAKLSSTAFDTSGPEEFEGGRARWKKVNSEEQKTNQRKQKCMIWQGYSLPVKKDAAPKTRKKAKEMKGVCSCRRQCGARISEEDRQSIFNTYWSLGDTDKQAQFVVDNIMRGKTGRQRKRQESKTGKRRNRDATNTYYIKGEQVCKVMFHHTLAVSEMYVKTCLAESNERLAYSTYRLHGIESNHRLIGPSNHRLNDQQANSIVAHIQSFPVMESRYLHDETGMHYLDSDLDIEKMYELYKERHVNAEFVLPSSQAYHRIFCERFNLAFHKPKKDRCTLCDAFKDEDGEENLALNEEYDQHLFDWRTAEKLKTQYKEQAGRTERHVVLCFDLQKVLPTPFEEDGEYCNVNKLSTYNLTCYDLIRKQGYCYMWNEAVSRCGVNEISSCIFKHLINSEFSPNTRLTMFADNCPGQNRNRWLMKMMSISLMKIPNLESIELVFLMKGHTYNENDPIHSRIEQSKKGETIHFCGERITLAEHACVIKPHHVKWMEEENFYDFHEDFNGVYVLMNKNEPMDADRKKKVTVKWASIRMVRFEKKDPHVMQYKYNLQETEFRIAVIGREQKKTSTRNSLNTGVSIELKTIHHAPLPITEKEKKALCLGHPSAIPAPYHNFYTSVPSTGGVVMPDDNFNDSDHDDIQD